MTKYFKLLFSSLFIATTSFTFAAAPVDKAEIISTLSQSTLETQNTKSVGRTNLDALANAAKILERNRFFIANHKYFAKRQRIVKVNVEALLNKDRTHTISLFDDAVITVKNESMVRNQNGDIHKWIGDIAHPSIPVEAFESLTEKQRHGLSPKAFSQLIQKIDFNITEWDRNTLNGKLFPSAIRPKPIARHIQEVPEGYPNELNDLEENAFKTISGKIIVNDPPHQKVYKIYPLENDPEYTLIIEVDPEITVGAIRKYMNAEQKAIREWQNADYKSYRDALGESK